MSDQATFDANAFFTVEDLHAYYGQSYIVQGVTFSINEGDVLALLGRNGAGKTTLLRACARAHDPQMRKGKISLNGKDISSFEAYQAAQNGVQLVQEDRRIISSLSVDENLQLAQISGQLGWSIDQIYEIFPRLGERCDQDGSTLSGGEQQMLALSRALVRDVKLLLLDEPYEGLAPLIVKEIERIVETIKNQGITTIIVEQNAVAALRLANRAIILDMGEIVFDGAADDIMKDKELRERYLAL